MSGVSLGTVVKGLRVLEQEGFLKIRRGPSRRIPNSYAVLISGTDPNRTIGEDLADLTRQHALLQRQVAALTERLAVHEHLIDAALVSQALPGGLHLLVVGEGDFRRVHMSRSEEERLIRRLLDRRGIGAGLRRLRQDPQPEAAIAFARRLERRLEAIPPVSLRVAEVLTFVRDTLLTLPQAEDLPAALAKAEARYEELVATLLRRQEAPGEHVEGELA
jgi:hypothetical protein